MIYDIVIVGGGPAGLTAAIYAARAGRSVLVLEKESFGGQITSSPMVDNFPACPHISGIELGNKMTEQAMSAGAELVSAEVIGMDRSEGLKFIIETDVGNYWGRAVILATGARHRHLGLPKEEELVGNGISYCAVCDGAFYENKTVAVVGGGNAAMVNALFLANICKKVILINILDYFQAEQVLIDKVRSTKNIVVMLNKNTYALNEKAGILTGIEMQDMITNVLETLSLDGVFVCIGHEPQSEPFALMGITDDLGYYDCDETTLTYIPGLFVAGDARAKDIRQLTTAVADGAVAGLVASDYVGKL